MRGTLRQYTSNGYVSGDHPRVCGEHLVMLSNFRCTPGSSPRMRGTRFRCSAVVVDGGIIPAYAGNTRRQEPDDAHCRDHPRVCGEHRDHHQPPWRRTGSSPRMRGTHLSQVVWRDSEGIIPAYAGTTRSSNFSVRSPRDHPRVCGEHQR